MKTTFNHAFNYMKMSLRTYVTARKFLDKLVACKLIIVSMIMATDALLAHYHDILESLSTPQLSNIRTSLEYLQRTYQTRVEDLKRLEEKIAEIKEHQFSSRLSRAISELIMFDDDEGVTKLFSLNFKEHLNDAQLYVLQIRNLLENQKSS